MAPVIEKALVNLSARDRLILSPHSDAEHERSFAGRRIFLTAQQVVFLEYVVRSIAKDYAFADRHWRNRSLASIAVELPRKDAGQVIRRFFDDRSFRGFVIPRDSGVRLQTLIDIQMEPIEPFDSSRVPAEVTWFEDADDGCALRIGPGRLTPNQVIDRLHQKQLDALVARIIVDPIPGKRRH